MPVAPPLQNGFPLTARGRFFLLLSCRLRLVLHGNLPSCLTQERREFLRRNRRREEITLHQITPDLLQRLHLFLGLHAFGHHRRGEVPCDLDDDLQHVGILLLSEGRADELHVQFQHVDGKRREHIQRGIARTEVIHLHQKSHGTQALHRLDDLFRVLGVGGFRHLQVQVPCLYLALFQDVQQGIHDVRVIHIHPRDVHGNGHGVADLVLPNPDLSGGLSPYIVIQVLYEPVFLKQRDEHAGADHAKLRVLPAHQTLRAGKVRLIAGDVELWLEEHTELTFLNGLGKVLDQLLRIQLGLV